MRKLLLLSVVLLFLSSCGWLNPSIMLKTGKHYQYSKLPDSSNVVKDYRISPNDILSFNLYSNNGFKLIDLTSLNQSNMGFRINNLLAFLVEFDGMIKLPILGRVKIAGLTIREAELMLEEKYSVSYVNPYVILDVNNRRVTIFPGNDGNAKVVPLVNNNTTLIEGIALAGGINEDGKARQVKLIRENGTNHDVYLIDLSTIKGIHAANIVLQANDIIYIEPRRKYSAKILQEIVPIVSLLTNLFIVFSYYRTVNKLSH